MATILREASFTTVEAEEAFETPPIDLRGGDRFSLQVVVDEDSSSGATVTFQKSNDAVNWNNIANSTAISADGSIWLEQTVYDYAWVKAVFAIASGSMDVDIKFVLSSICPPSGANL